MPSNFSGTNIRRLGILGGSFDPVHIAHLLTAEAAVEALNLDRVLFVPVGEQPLKRNRQMAAAQHRLAMVDLAIRDNPRFALSSVDIDRPGPSYTADTIKIIGEQSGNSDEITIWFIMGADSLGTLPRWHDPGGITARARLAVVRRPGSTIDMAQLTAQLPQLESAIDWVDAPLMEISATDLRERVAHDKSIRYRVPDAVMEYIQEKGLYK